MRKLILVFILICSVFLCGCSMKKPQQLFNKAKMKAIEFTKKRPETTLEKIKERNYIIVGVDPESKPFCYKENGEYKGFDVDIAKAISNTIFENENKIKFIEVSAETRITKLMTEEIDMIIATMTDTPERRMVIDFSDSYYISGQAILCKKNSQVSSAADLANHNTAIIAGTTAEKTLKQLRSRSHIVRFKTYGEAYARVKNTDDTCIITDESLLKGFIMDNPDYIIFNKRYTVEPYAVGIRAEDEDLKNMINYTLQLLKNSGDLDKINKKWIK